MAVEERAEGRVLVLPVGAVLAAVTGMDVGDAGLAAGDPVAAVGTDGFKDLEIIRAQECKMLNADKQKNPSEMLHDKQRKD